MGMGNRRWAFLTLGAVSALLSTSGARAADTPVSFTLTAGALSISVPTTTVDLGSGAAGTGLSGQLGTVTVSDQRGVALASWTAQVTATDFTAGSATIPKANLSYWSGLSTAFTGLTGTGVVLPVPGQLTAANAQTLGSARTAFSASNVVGTHTVSWNPTIVVAPPPGTVTGTYSGTITHSVA